MPDVAQARPVTDGVLAALDAATAHPVGDHTAPAVTSGPYTILYSIPGGSFDGSMGGPHEMAVFRYQVDSHNRSRDGAEWLADRNRTALLTGDFTVDGWRIMYVDITPGSPMNEGRDDENELPLFVIRDDVAVQVTKGPLAED